MGKITVKLSKEIGEIRPLHGVNNAPFSWGEPEYVTKMFRSAAIPHCRLHDTQGEFGGSHFVDVPNIFPDFDADPDDPENYDFTCTDAFLKPVTEANTEIVYRLGVTIEWGPKKYNIHPPKDNLQWAKICEGIIRHYTEGWADGFRYPIRYWEIWNEPENPPMWTGTKEQFFRLYAVSSKYLKETFPHLLIGGYGSCGFYAHTREGMDDFYKSFLTYFSDFLAYIKEENAPLDFFSWHIYGDNVEELIAHAHYARDVLDANGYQDTETFLDEWNYGAEGKGFEGMHSIIGATYVASSMCAMQNAKVPDKAMYYCATLNARYNGLFDLATRIKKKQFYALEAFGTLYQLGTQIETESDTKDVYVCGAKDGKKSAIMIVNYSDKEQPVYIEGIDLGNYNCSLLSDTKDFEPIPSEASVVLPKYSIILLKSNL